MSKRSEIHDKVLQAQSLEEVANVYHEWAQQYDRDLMEHWGYQAPQQSVALLLHHLTATEATILDAGCGTGLVGQLLKQAGRKHLIGIDYSEAMLAEAAAKGCYQTLQQADLNQPLAMPTNQVDAVICVGTFTLGHVQPEALRELVRVTRPGGFVCFTVRQEFWEQVNFARMLNQLKQESRVSVLEQQEIEYIRTEGSTSQLLLLTVLDQATT